MIREAPLGHWYGQWGAVQQSTPHQHESRGVARLLAGRDLTGTVVTFDAGLTHPQLARQIRQQGGHYLMGVKRNHARLHEELTWYFDTPPLRCDRPWQQATTWNKGHGRLERRVLTCTDDLDGYLTWPDVQTSSGASTHGCCSKRVSSRML